MKTERLDNEGLKREIGVWGLVANSINIIIGAGIFILPVIVAERLGTASIWAYIICGMLMILIMLCFVEAGTKIIRTGGAYSYIEDAFGRYAGFLTTNIFIFGAAVMANAAVANGLVNTLAYFIPGGFFVPGISVAIIFWVLSNLPLKELGAMLIFLSGLTLIYFALKIFAKINI